MARPIKETPILTGKDARIFEQKMENPRPVSQEEIKTAREDYNSWIAIADFAF